MGSMIPANDGSDEVSNDAMQLMVVATFNGLCRTIAALARQGRLSEIDIRAMHDSMNWPLEDPNNRDNAFVASVRDTVDIVFAEALAACRAAHD